MRTCGFALHEIGTSLRSPRVSCLFGRLLCSSQTRTVETDMSITVEFSSNTSAPGVLIDGRFAAGVPYGRAMLFAPSIQELLTDDVLSQLSHWPEYSDNAIVSMLSLPMVVYRMACEYDGDFPTTSRLAGMAYGLLGVRSADVELALELRELAPLAGIDSPVFVVRLTPE